MKQGEQDNALDAYRRGREIVLRLVALAPDRVGFKRNLDWFEARIAELESAPQDPTPGTTAATRSDPQGAKTGSDPAGLTPSAPQPAQRGWLRRLLGR